MGRTFRTALIALTVAAAVSGCGSDPAPETEALEVAAQAGAEFAAFCDAARSNLEAGRPLVQFAAAGGAPRPAEEVSAVTEPLRESNRDMLSKAPQELRTDMEAISELAEMQLTVFEATGGDAAAAANDPAYVARATELQDVTTRFRLFLRNTCRIAVD